MGNNQNNQFGKKIEKALGDALSTGDFTGIKSTVIESVDSVFTEVIDKIDPLADVKGRAKNLSEHREEYSSGAYTRYRQQKLEEEKRARQAAMQEKMRAAEEERKKKEAELAQKRKQEIIHVPMNQVGKYSSTMCTVVGGTGVGITTLSMLGTIPKLIFGSASMAGLGVGVFFLIAFGIVLGKGIGDGKRLALAKRFALLSGTKGYVEIDNIIRSTGISSRKAIRNIKRLLSLGFFPQGRLDDDNQNLILTDAVYEQYKESKRNYIDVDVSKDTIDDLGINDENLTDEQKQELHRLISEGNEYISMIHELNDKIPGEVITEKLYRLEGLLVEIFDRVRVHPEQMPKMHELMDYYLPTMLKLVKAYEEYDKVSAPGEDIIKAKSDIEDTLDTINIAFRKLLNNLFKDSVWDVTSDAQVLKSLLTQTGLAGQEEGE